MPPPPSPKPAFLLLLATALFSNAASQDTTNPFTWLDCPSQSPPTTGATDSTFRRNLQALLDALPAAAASTGFASLSRGEGRDRAFVRGLCRGDSGPDDCLAYLKSAVLYINGNCNSSTRAAVWYDRCSVSYADTNASIAHEDDFRYELDNAGNVSDPATFEQTYYALMRRLAARAANGSSGRMFATGEASYAPGGTMYGLVQCMRDRTAAECGRCLEKSMRRLPRCCWGHQGGVVLAYNCYLRFEIFKYYDLALDAPPPVSPGPPRSKLSRRGKKRATAVLAIALPLGVVLILFFVCGAFLQRRRIMEKRSPRVNTNREDITYVEPEQLNLPVLRAATDNFSQESKLGEGGFGEVFKGKLKDGQVIAVKRLSKNSRQGFHELKNELVVASKLKHRNLVELLGVCLQEEQLVVYEYMPNRSLDTILFDSEIKRQLDWAKRYTIICGIARGLLYLHHESRLKVIHRDLKPSNVLLDRDMNPKISDFGLARAFWQDQSRDITARPVGTLGYMSPEYAYYGHVSSKSDMFSFGVIVLEIITGRRNNSSYECADSKPLLSYVWEKWSTGSIEEIVDASLGGQYPPDEVFKCVHIGLLCVQENPSGRPDVSGVVSMLDSHSTSLQAPSKPAFFFGLGGGGNALLNGCSTQDASRNDQLARPVSKNEMTISELAPR